MSKNNKKTNKKTIENIDKKIDSSAIDKKTEFVNGLGASAEFTSVD